MEHFEIVDLFPLHRQMMLVVFRDPNTNKCEVQILPVSLETMGLESLQEMLKIPTEPGENAEIASVKVEETLRHEILDWCEVRGITSEQLVRAFISFCGEPKNSDVVKAWVQQEFARSKSDQ